MDLLPYEELPGALARLRDSKTALPAQGAIELTALTACRQDDAREARWDELVLSKTKGIM